MMGPDRIAVVVGAVLALLLQIAFAPYIAVFGIVPNVLAAFCLVVAVSRPGAYGALLPFILGLAFDLTAGGPVGGMAFCLTAFSCLASRLSEAMDNDTLFMPLSIMAICLLLMEVSYGVFLLAFGYNAGLLQALVYRALPCFVYDLVIAVVLYLFIGRFFRQATTIHHDITSLR